MNLDYKIKDNDLTIFCTDNLKEFAQDFKLYFDDNIEKIKDFFDINEKIELLVALTDKKEDVGFIYGESSFCGFFNDKGAFAYININGDKSNEYMKKGLMHEIVHHIYKFYVYGKDKPRITWVDEGLAQFLSRQKDKLNDIDLYKNFLLENVKDYEQININNLNHEDKSFGMNNGYNLSYIAIRYLHDVLNKKDFIDTIKDKDKLYNLGNTIINNIKDYCEITINKNK